MRARQKCMCSNFTTGYTKAIQWMVIWPPTFTWFSILPLEGVNLKQSLEKTTRHHCSYCSSFTVVPLILFLFNLPKTRGKKRRTSRIRRKRNGSSSHLQYGNFDSGGFPINHELLKGMSLRTKAIQLLGLSVILV